MARKSLLPICVVALGSSLLSITLSGCSLLIDVSGTQCSVDLDCERRSVGPKGSVCRQNFCVTPDDDGSGGEAGAPADPLACKPEEASMAPTVKYTFAPVFAPGAEPSMPKPFTVRACGTLDLTCEKPVDQHEVTAGVPQDFLVPPGFAGWFWITNPDTLDGLLFLGRPVVKDTIGWEPTLPSADVVTQLKIATATDIDPDLGIIILVTRDCAAERLAHVSVTNSQGGLGFYFVMNLPDKTLTETGPQGAAGFANVPIGTTSLSGMSKSGHPLGPVSLRIKPRTVSLAELWP